MDKGFGWLSILRLGLVQTSIGAIVVLTTSTLNRVMVVEYALAAAIPGALVGIHYAVQILRPLWGHGSDIGGRRTPWIVGGVGLLGLAATGAAVATTMMGESFAFGLTLALLDFVLIGFGVGAAGTSLLALLASGVRAERRPAAASIVWLMMIAGMATTAIVAGGLLEPFTPQRLVAVTAGTSLVALAVTVLAVIGIEKGANVRAEPDAAEAPPVGFRQSLADAWADPRARLFTIFVFVSMLAYSAQDLILEPFGGLVFGMSPGETTRLAGIQHGGVFLGMVSTGVLASLLSGRYPGALRAFTVFGCAASAMALAALAIAAAMPDGWPLVANVFLLGVANGIFAVAAIGSMMALAGAAGRARTGMRMGLWGAAQAIAFGLGGLAGTIMVDAVRLATGEAATAYGATFLAEACVFLLAAAIAARIAVTAHRGSMFEGRQSLGDMAAAR